MTLLIRAMDDRDVEPLVALWEACGLIRPWNPPRDDIARARGREGSDLLVGEASGTLFASVMVGHDGHRGWVYYLAVAPKARGLGHGATMMRAAEAWLRARGIRKLELMIRDSNAGAQRFYEQHGYGREPVIVMSRWLDGTQPG